jgi:hypothetical protein
MKTLVHRHLMTLQLEVDFGRTRRIGAIASGYRGIAQVTGGSFTGERLSGKVESGADWYVIQPDGTLLIDVRLNLTGEDGVPIYLTYQGAMRGRGDAMARFAKGALLDPAEYSIVVNARLESGDARYTWLNALTLIGTGTQTLSGPIYEIFEIGDSLT